jgi:hypothetical protein
VGAPAALLTTLHLLGCAFIAWLALLVIGLGENRTSAEQESAERFGYLMFGLFGLAILVWLLLLARRWWWAVLVSGAEALVGLALVVRWLEESVHSDAWVYVTALAIALTGLGALTCARFELTARDQARRAAG